ncbi:MAG: fibronectin type III domain-containing protein [Prolixibacteraceae bacterium]|jgi:hypothetical protein|nr:fibronectin type III domain-containing protein [Prolixibacteraceae bacterium]
MHGSNGYNGTLNNFALTGSTSNWVESYAMVVPTAATAYGITTSGFTANWTAPETGPVNNYKLYVATDAAFASLVSGYNPLTLASTSTSSAVTGLATNTTYYYRVQADKTSLTGQGAYSSSITVQTKTNFTWSGTGTWSETAKWSPASLPTTNANVTVSGGTLTIDQDATVSSVVINAGDAVTIAAGKTLTVNGNFTLKSDASHTASLINNGTLTVTDTTKAECYLTGNKWHVISPTAEGSSVGAFIQAAGNAIPYSLLPPYKFIQAEQR